MSKMVSLEEIAQNLLARDDFVICGHIGPDGDCLGSQLALAFALRSLGKAATCLLAKADAVDYSLSQLPGMQDMVVAKDFDGVAGTFVTVDVPSAMRMGEEAARLHGEAAHTISIDHHLSREAPSQLNYVDAESPSTTMIVWKLIELLGVTPSQDMATCCFVGLMTDTGRFQYQNTTAEAFVLAGEMIGAGAKPAELAQLLYQNRSAVSLALEERMLAHRQFLFDGRFALSHLLISDFSETGAERSDAEDLIDVLRSIRGVRVVCLLREQDDNVRGSLRAKDDTDVSKIAERIGGGGHKAAAGFTFEGGIEDAIACICSEIATVFDE